MKSSIASAALLCAPQIFAAALPHHKDESNKNSVAHVRRREAPDHGHELKRRSPGRFPQPTAPIDADNPFLGNHPFQGHGPVVPNPTAAPNPIGYPSENFTLTYLATGTTPPVANGTATVYIPPALYPITNGTTTPDSDAVVLESLTCDFPDEYDDDGILLPRHLQPKFNSTASCTPANITFMASPPQAERIEVEGQMRGDHQIVEVEITTLPLNATHWYNITDLDQYNIPHADDTDVITCPSGASCSLPAVTPTDTGLPPGPTALFPESEEPMTVDLSATTTEAIPAPTMIMPPVELGGPQPRPSLVLGGPGEGALVGGDEGAGLEPETVPAGLNATTPTTAMDPPVAEGAQVRPSPVLPGAGEGEGALVGGEELADPEIE